LGHKTPQVEQLMSSKQGFC